MLKTSPHPPGTPLQALVTKTEAGGLYEEATGVYEQGGLRETYTHWSVPE